MRVRSSLILGTVFFLVQIAWVIWTAPGQDLSARWDRLFQWDSRWYADLSDHGYRTEGVGNNPEQMNLAYFPIFPGVGALVSGFTGLRTSLALTLSAQAFAWAAWILFFALLARLGTGRVGRVLAGVFVLSYPGSFFLVVPYSESVFVFFLLLSAHGFLEARQPSSLALTGLAGASMSRVVGIGLPLAYFAARACFGEAKRQWHLLLALFPFAVHLIFLGIQFGNPFIFHHTHANGWGEGIQLSRFDLGFFTGFHKVFWLTRDIHHGGAFSMGIAAVMVFLIAALGIVWLVSFSRSSRLQQSKLDAFQSYLFFAAAGLSWTPILLFSKLGFQSQIRYQLPPLILLAILISAGPIARSAIPASIWRWARWPLAAAFVAITLRFFMIQSELIYQFTIGGWVG